MNTQIPNEDSAIKPAMITPANDDPNFYSIDDSHGWPPFMLSMLRVGRIFLKKVNQRHGVTAQQIGRTMARHQNEVGTIYRPLEIRELIGNYNCFFIGGGVQVEAEKIEYSRPSKRCPDYRFTFTKLFRPGEDGRVEGTTP